MNNLFLLNCLCQFSKFWFSGYIWYVVFFCMVYKFRMGFIFLNGLKKLKEEEYYDI